ncbi:hypothetical protein AURDEDRAFT_114369 [Auricularia subglabra TFB-10046 SS5]|nr:hypothetical protein AURDEDRAFT_114369 [Auricularia subglabra TFB-10046 SS5]
MKDEFDDYDDESWGDLSLSQLDAIDPVRAKTPPTPALAPGPSQPVSLEEDDEDSGSEALEVDGNLFITDTEMAAMSTQQFNLLTRRPAVELPEDEDDDDDDEARTREQDEQDLPLHRRSQPTRPLEPLPPLFNRPPPTPLTRQTTASTLRSASSTDSLAAAARSSNKRRYSDVDTEATSQSTTVDSPKRRQLGQSFAAPACKPLFLAYAESLLPQIAPLPFLVQWELACLGSNPQFPLASVPLDDPALAGSNEAGVERLHALEGGNAKRLAKLKRDGVMKELDLEDDALLQDQYGCLGGLPDSTYYGGKVLFSATVKILDGKAVAAGDSAGLAIILNEPAVGPSTRLTRRFGSDRIIRLRVPDQDGIQSILEQPFVLHANVFRSFFAKDGTAFLLRTDETLEDIGVYEGALPPPYKPHHTGLPKLTLDSFFAWANDPVLNCNQGAGKWSSRLALFLSTSIPAFRVKKENVHFISDIAGEGCQPGEKVPTEKNMTDGSGFVNRAGLEACQKRVEMDYTPSGAQGRIGGAKGMFFRHPQAGEYGNLTEPEIWIRASQEKIKYAAFSPTSREPVDEAFLTFDLLKVPHTSAARLSAQLILNTESNGVPARVFVTLQEAALDELVVPLTTWAGDRGMPNLAAQLEQKGLLFARRLATLAAGAARARGHRNRENEDVVEDDPDGVSESAVAACLDRWGEVCLRLLHARFHPQSCKYLYDILRSVIKTHIESFVKDYHIELPLSAQAFIAPDPFGVLEVGEIFFHPRSHTLRDVNGHEFDDNVLLGDVLVGRHPCVLPTDVRKVVAVDSLALRPYRDIIFFSTKGTRSLANILSGGDYDGDTAVLIWQTEVVQPFQNAPLHLADPPANVETSFEAEMQSVKDLLTNGHFNHLRLSFLLSGLKKNPVGLYSNFHLLACYVQGYRNEETRRLAHISGQLLDAPKTGKRLVPGVFEEDKGKWRRRMPACIAETEEVARFAEFSNQNFAKRPPGMREFVLDVLQKAGRRAADRHLAGIEQLMPQISEPDAELVQYYFKKLELARPWKAAIPAWLEHFKLIRDHVDGVLSKYRAMNRDYAKDKNARTAAVQTPSKTVKRPIGIRSPSKRGETCTVLADGPSRQRQVQDLRVEFNSGPVLPGKSPIDPTDLPMLRASYAYYTCTERREDLTAKFAFDMALHELCKIKVEALGAGESYRVLCHDFYFQMRAATFTP